MESFGWWDFVVDVFGCFFGGARLGSRNWGLGSIFWNVLGSLLSGEHLPGDERVVDILIDFLSGEGW